jgi:hypothetical protein
LLVERQEIAAIEHGEVQGVMIDIRVDTDPRGAAFELSLGAHVSGRSVVLARPRSRRLRAPSRMEGIGDKGRVLIEGMGRARARLTMRRARASFDLSEETIALDR